MFDQIKDWVVSTADTPYGIYVAAGLMALESMIAPVPSEFVMPPLGMVISHHEKAGTVGQFGWTTAIIATTIGSLIGSLISYYMGYYGGKPLVMKVGRYLLVNEHHLDLTSDWFKRWGGITVFICRFVPVVRHLISIPAGIARMNLLKFSLYTLVGAAMWNSLLLWLGWRFQENIDQIMKYRTPVDVTFAALIVIAVAAWYWLHLKKPAAPHRS